MSVVGYVYGNSPSLGDMKPEDFHSSNSIGCNRILRNKSGFSPERVLIVDPNVVQEEWDRIVARKAKLVLYRNRTNPMSSSEEFVRGRDVVLRRSVFSGPSAIPKPEVIEISKNMTSRIGDRKETDPYEFTGTTASYMVEWLARRGCDEIVVYGVDFCMPRDGRATHHFGDARTQGVNAGAWLRLKRDQGMVTRWIEWFKKAERELRAVGIGLWSGSPWEHSLLPLERWECRET